MPTEDAYYSSQLVLSDFGIGICSGDENMFFETCIASELLSFDCPLVLPFCFVPQHFWLRYSRTALLLWLYILSFAFTLYRVFSNYVNISLIKHVKDWLTRNLISLTHFCIYKTQNTEMQRSFYYAKYIFNVADGFVIWLQLDLRIIPMILHSPHVSHAYRITRFVFLWEYTRR